MLLALGLALVALLATFPAATIGAGSQATANEKADVCHASNSETNPYQSLSVPIDNKDGTINGHETHTGPVFPAPNWGDIIRPYTWTDDKGVVHVNPGYNWSDEGQAIMGNGCNLRAPPTPTTSLAIVKALSPADDSGTFALRIDGAVAGGASAVGNGGTTGKVSVAPGTRTVSESPAEGTDTDLGDYTIRTICTRGNGTVAEANGPSVDVPVREGDEVTCVISNTVKPPPDSETVDPVLECVVLNDGQPDVAVWGYNNRNGHPVTIPIGPSNRFTPDPEGRGQPTTFENGRVVGVVQTPFEAGADTLTWRLAGNEASASARSRRCNATVELRKVVIPADDPGAFELRINGNVVATGGNGTTTGPVTVGAGEATARETAGPGTNLADYDSSVECTRNGEGAGSTAGTKIDAAIASGDVVVCTFTNRRRGVGPTPPQPPPGPARQLDLIVTKSVQPDTVVVGGRLTWRMTVTNQSSVAAADVNGVKVDDPRSFRTRLISLRPSQGTCRPYTCDLGRLAPGASATVTAVTEATQVGVVANIVRVSSEEIESNYRNNVAAALALVTEPLTVCRTLTAEPRLLQSGRSSLVRVTAQNALGKPVQGLRVRVRGANVDRRARTDRQGVARFAVSPATLGIMFFSGDRARAAGPLRCRTVLGVLGASATQVTG